VPALITFGVTLLRLVGELNHWSPAFFNRSPGGGGALIGIVWLIPIVAAYFAVKLHGMGLAPRSKGRAIGLSFAGFAVFAASAAAVFALRLPPLGQVIAVNLGTVLGAFVAYRGWPALARTEIAYGYAARIPVAIVMLLAIANQWDTHYTYGPPDFPPMGVLATWFWIAFLPQMIFWVGFTVLFGSIAGSLALLFVGRRD
jgi:hypothetical protein